MIVHEYNSYILQCDICDEIAPRRYNDFQDAVDYKKELGWKSKKIDGEWNDICKNCQ